MVVLAASICTRGGKAVLSRQFREMQRSRVEALLASFPKLADSGTQHTTVEQDNVRYVYQPLDELYMVLITNRQSNILQDIDSLHLFAQVTTTICRSLDEREILRNAFELISAFDELVHLGYRENLNLNQIKTFLEMESHEERVAMIIEDNKRREADAERKRRAKQIEIERQQAARMQRDQVQRTPQFPTYTPSVPTTVVQDHMDSYSAEKNRSKPIVSSGKGMQLGKKNRTNNAFDQIRSELGPEEPLQAPLVSQMPAAQPAARATAQAAAANGDREAVHVTVSESISAKISREGNIESFDVAGNLQLRITDAAMTQIKLNLLTDDSRSVQWTTHPKVDKQAWQNGKLVQLKDTSRGFPSKGTPLEVLRWKHSDKSGSNELPLTLTAWVNEGDDNTYSITVEYELAVGESLKDVTVSIPFTASEPSVSSFDAVYEVSGDSIEWKIGTIDSDNSNGSLEFEATAESDSAFFPMRVAFGKTTPFIDVDVSSVTLLNMNQDVPYSRDVKSVADKYMLV